MNLLTKFLASISMICVKYSLKIYRWVMTSFTESQHFAAFLCSISCPLQSGVQNKSVFNWRDLYTMQSVHSSYIKYRTQATPLKNKHNWKPREYIVNSSPFCTLPLLSLLHTAFYQEFTEMILLVGYILSS